MARRQECSFQEWHTDGMFGPSPPTCTVLHCKQEGNSYTGFADGRQVSWPWTLPSLPHGPVYFISLTPAPTAKGYRNLPDDLREFADASAARYRPSIIYGNPKIGASSTPAKTAKKK